MDVRRDAEIVMAGDITITIPIDEAYRLYNFIEFASRPSMEWEFTGDYGERFLHKDDDYESKAAIGLAETRELAKMLQSFITEEEEFEFCGLDN